MIFSSIVVSSPSTMEIALPRFESILAAPSRGAQGNYVPFSIGTSANSPAILATIFAAGLAIYAIASLICNEY